MKSKRSKSEKWLIITTMIIPIYAFVLFYLVPNIGGFFMAFLNREGELTFKNFERVFNMLASAESDLRIGFRNTFLAFGLNLVLYPFKFLVSYFLYKKIPGHTLYRILFKLPGLMVGAAISLVIAQLLYPTGFIAEFVGKNVGLDYAPELLADSRFANKTLFLQMIWMGFPGDIIIWGGTLARIPEELIEAGKIDGTTWITECTRIVVPLVWPMVGLNMVLMFCSIFSSGTNAFLMTKGEYGTMTFGCWQTLQMLAGGGSNYGSGSLNFMAAVGLCVTLIAVPLALVVRRLAGKLFTEVEF